MCMCQPDIIEPNSEEAFNDFKEKVTFIMDCFLSTREDGTEKQDIDDLKSLIFYEVLKCFYKPETTDYLKELEDGEEDEE